MASRTRCSEGYELLRRTSSDSVPASDSELEYGVSVEIPEGVSIRSRIALIAAPFRAGRRSARTQRHTLWSRVCCYAIVPCAGTLLVLVLATAVFWPSYTHPPHHYHALRKSCTESTDPGRGNTNNEKVFIAAALYDPRGALVGGDWGSALLGLVDLLGPDNVYVSVYENGADSAANSALDRLKDRLDWLECR